MDQTIANVETGQRDITIQEAHVVDKEENFITKPISLLSLANRLVMPDAEQVETTPAGITVRRIVSTTVNENLETMVQLDTYTWTTSQATGTTIETHPFPQYYFAQMSDTFVTRMLGNYAYMKWDEVEFEIRMNSTKFHQGYIRVFTFPQRSRSNVDNAQLSVHNNNTIVLPGGDLYANKSNSIFFCVPWQQTHPYIPIGPEFNDTLHTLFYLNFRIIIPLSSSSTNEDHVDVLLFARFKGVSVGVRDLFHALPTSYYDFEEDGIKFTKLARVQSALSGAISGSLETAMAVESGNVMGAITSGIKTANNIAALIDNLDKPLYHETSRVAVRSSSSIAHGSGISLATKLGLTASDTHVTPRELSSSVDEMDLIHIAQQYGIAGIVEWSQSSPKGTQLARINCNYLYAYWDQNSTRDVWSPIPLSFVAARYKLAKGGLKIRLKIVSSSIHSGRLIASFYPHIAGGPAETIKALTSLKNYVMDFSETAHIFEFIVPYYSSDAWFILDPSREVYNAYPNLTSVVPTGFGFISLNVDAALITTSQISNSVSVVIEIAGASDFMVAQPTRGFPYQDNTVTVKAQVLEVNNTTLAKRSMSEVTALKNIFHGDEIETYLPSLLRRYGGIAIYRWSVTDWSQIAWINTPLLALFWDSDAAGDVNIRNPTANIAYFGLLYAFWSGPLRYNIVTTLTRVQQCIATLRLDPNNADYVQTGPFFQTPNITLNSTTGQPPLDRFNMPTEILNGASQPVFEVEVPFVSQQYMKECTDAITLPTYNTELFAGWLTMSLLNENTTAEKFSFWVLQSAGDSFRYHAFIGVPLIYLPSGTLNIP